MRTLSLLALIGLALTISFESNCQDYALKFDGTDDYLKVDHSSELFPSHFTITAWINPSSLSWESTDYIISTKHGGGYSLGVNITGDTNYTDRLSARCMVNGTYYNIYGTSLILQNTWTHVALSYDGSHFKIYVNGVEENQLAVTGALTPAISPIYIGAESAGYWPASNQRFRGLMHEITLFNSALSNAEILDVKDQHFYTDHSKWDDLIGYWKINEASGLSAYDFSGNGHTAQLKLGPLWSELECSDYSVKLDGDQDFLKIDYVPELFPEKITLAAWINPNLISNYDYIMSTKHGGGYSLRFNNAGGAEDPNVISARCSVNGTYYNISSTSDILQNVWTHVALTFDGNDFRIYVNGQEENQLSVSGNLSPAISPLYIGAESKGELTVGGYFDGSIDETALFDIALIPSEIEELMNKQMNFSHSKWDNLVGYWKMDEESGDMAYDISNQANEATLFNEATEIVKCTFGNQTSALSYINSFQTWTNPTGGIIKSPDPSGICYNELSNDLFIVDSEINEYASINPKDKNVFNFALDGSTLSSNHWVDQNLSTTDSDVEPTGITFDADLNVYFITNDNNKTIIKCDENFNTLDSVTIGSGTNCTGCDPEGIANDPNNQFLYVADGVAGSTMILTYDYSLNLIDSFSVANRIIDPEGIAFHPELETLFIVNGGGEKKIFEYTTGGVFLNEFYIGGFIPAPISPQGLSFGAPSNNDDGYSLYIADGMLDNEGSGGEANSKNGRIYEAKLEDIGTSDCAIELNGLTDYVLVEESADLFPTEITMAAWINPSYVGSGDYIISTKHGGGYSLGIDIESGGEVTLEEISARCHVNGAYHNIYGTTNIPSDTWTHVALTYDGSIFKIYVNGVKQNELSVSGSLSSANSRLFIGTESHGTIPAWDHGFQGKIDDVAIFNTAIDSSTIQTLMDKQLYPSHSNWTNLIGYWKLDDGAGSLAFDSSGNGHTGSLINDTFWDCDSTSMLISDPPVSTLITNDEDKSKFHSLYEVKVDTDQMKVNIFPNPAQSKINIETIRVENYLITIYNSQGKYISKFTNAKKINIESYPQGSYFLKIMDIDSGETLVKQFIKSDF